MDVDDFKRSIDDPEQKAPPPLLAWARHLFVPQPSRLTICTSFTPRHVAQRGNYRARMQSEGGGWAFQVSV